MRYVAIIGAGAFLLLAGCGGSEWAEIRVPSEQQHVLASAAGSPAALTLPADRPFAIHLKKSSQDPGADGQAAAASDATAAGEAFCRADAAGGGSAAAEFALGHRIDNRSAAPQSTVIEIEFDLRQSASGSSQPAAGTIATANLTLVVIDGRRKVLARVPLVQATSDQAFGQASGHERRSLTVPFEPQQTYDVMLFGKVESATAPAQNAAAALEIRGLTMQLQFAAAATQPAAKPPPAM